MRAGPGAAHPGAGLARPLIGRNGAVRIFARWAAYRRRHLARLAAEAYAVESARIDARAAELRARGW